MRKALIAVNRAVHQVCLLIGELSLAAMLLVVTATVVLRYFFGMGIGWAEEVPRLLVTLFTFLACAMGVRDKTHICVTFVYNKVGPHGKRALDILVDVCILLCGLFMLYYGWLRCGKMMRLSGTLPMTGLRTWWQYLPIPLSGFLISFDSILFLTGVLKPTDTLFTEPDIDYSQQVLHSGAKEVEGA